MISLATVVLGLASSALGARLCANVVPPETRAQMEADFSAKRRNASLSGGHVPQDQIDAQIEVLNEAYAGTGLTFNLVNQTYVTQATWFARASPYSDGISSQNAMKQALRQGDASTLNLYSVGFSSGTAAGGLLGYATFPSDYESAEFDDGVVFLYSSTPGGTTSPFNLGGTVQHEVGHWTGLYHTFNEGDLEGTCNGSSDEVDDTPAEKDPASGCPEGLDSCPSLEGLDPIHNYMDYTDDACYTEFTAGQIDRLQDQMATYRGIVF
ncbi:metalloprotease [Flagelloscypha sp. PMI_526]|nr:metalloprotease [Flagelloscypha sp. PMI_526]